MASLQTLTIEKVACFLCGKERIGWTAKDLEYIQSSLTLCPDHKLKVAQKLSAGVYCGDDAHIEPAAAPLPVFKEAPRNPPNFQDVEPEERFIQPPREREPGEEG
jgi:hypothetical protein